MRPQAEPTQRIGRKLAAILAADMVGYSRLMGADEEDTLERLKALRHDLIDPTITAHHGRIIKTTGDGLLAEFASPVEAVRCAIQMQQSMGERNTGVAPERCIRFRFGINLGDVLLDGGDVFGDGVNVAARLETLAEPGGLCISGAVYDLLDRKLASAFTAPGKRRLKNIARPVRVYKLILEAGTEARRKASLPRNRSRRRPARTIPRLSIVVLPFANLSGDAAQDYLADVITEELTANLSRIQDSFVIARSTAFTYKGKAVDVKQVGKELGVRYALEGSAQPSGNRVRVNAQLIDAATGAHLWADQFDADRADLLQMQDEIVTRLARALEIQLVAVDTARLARKHPGNLDAEDLAMRCEVALINSQPGTDEREASYSLCERALQIDGRNVRALILLTYKFIIPVLSWASTGPQADIRRADELASRALAIDPNAYGAHLAKSYVLIAQKRHEEAIVEAERSLVLNHSHVIAYEGLCIANTFLGRFDRIIEYADKAIRLSPRDPLLYLFYWHKGHGYFHLHQDDKAIEWLRRATAVAAEWPLPQAFLAATLALNGQEVEARETLQRYLSLSDTRARALAQWTARPLPSDNPIILGSLERVRRGLRKAGMPE